MLAVCYHPEVGNLFLNIANIRQTPPIRVITKKREYISHRVSAAVVVPENELTKFADYNIIKMVRGTGQANSSEAYKNRRLIMEKEKIFISYSWKDRDYVQDLISGLKEHYEVFSIDSFSDVKNIADALSDSIVSSDAVIAVYSKNYADSLNANMELSFAFAHHKKVITIAIGDVLLPFYLESIQYNRINDFKELLQVSLNALSKVYGDFEDILNAKTKNSGKTGNLDEVITALNNALVDNQLILVCGAGISIPSGIPMWNDLIVSMIDNELFSGKHLQNPHDTSAEELISKMPQSSIILGKYLKLISGKNYDNNVKKALYREIEMLDDFSDTYADTKLMDAITELARPKRRGRQLESIITFNFDDIIETKLKKMNIDYCSIWKEGQSNDVNALPIYHVHGFLPYRGDIDEPNLVFSEEAYHSQFIDPYSWSNLLQLNAFSNNVCLFVGLSLSDPNLRRLLDISWRRNQRKKHYIVMKRSMHEDICDENVEEKKHITDIANMLIEQDANSLGLNVIWCSDYDEIPGILRKIAELKH